MFRSENGQVILEDYEFMSLISVAEGLSSLDIENLQWIIDSKEEFDKHVAEIPPRYCRTKPLIYKNNCVERIIDLHWPLTLIK